MSTSSSLPALDQCVDVYAAVWRRYGDDPFTVDALLSEFEGPQYGIDPATVDVPRHLDLLTAYGLLDRDDEGYRLRCRPDEDVDAWQERQVGRVERLHDAVRTAREEGALADAGETGESAFARYRGERYAPVAFADVDDDADLVAFATEALSGDERVAGVVVRAPGTDAREVQDLGDRLDAAAVTPDSMPDDSTPAESTPDASLDSPVKFEKVGSTVRGDDADDLEFRLYLRPERDEG
jgi:hypothetical protein